MVPSAMTPAEPPTPYAGGLTRVRVRVPAKINLALCVGPLGEDGYHRLGTVFHAVSLFDEVIATLAHPGDVRVTVKGEGAHLVDDATNLALRAARLLEVRYEFDEDPGVHLEVRKQIPVGGGMAGGSADGAAALLACSMLWDLDTSPDDLLDLASELGSDVPFALMGGSAIGRGRGTELVPMITRGTYHWVLAIAEEGLSTPVVFQRFDDLGAPGNTTIPPEVMEALTTGDVPGLGKGLRNDLQAAAIDLRPELGEVLESGMSAGALGGVVSGSGPTVAFLAGSESAAMDLSRALLEHRFIRETRRAVGPVPGARPYNCGS